jgi:O-antigen ligase
VVAIARAWTARAALAAAAVMLVAMLGPLLIVQPQYLTSVTGRDAVQLEMSTRSRTDSWQAAVGVWSSRPALGYGPGQSAVRLAGEPLSLRGDGSDAAILGSAHGVPMAALVDAGVFGFGLWLLLLGSVVFIGVRAVLREPTWLLAGLFAAALVGILASLVAGDRLELFAWVILGLMVVVGSGRGESRGV